MISNDMMKAGNDFMHKALLSIFNSILSFGIYPKVWKLSLITPIYKAKDPDDPGNYRPVTVSDCLCKMFCKIINNRIENYLKENNLLRINQNGFQEKRRTEDNIFILHTLFQKYVKKERVRFM